ncbi:hypothetical protein [Chelativorans sp. M5D2P16]|nr:hypothetical protein [Chelativorans sp. M5D2P16]MDZ5698980.1 hypothetical protein [Chelativorans sp. M5D2P16]
MPELRNAQSFVLSRYDARCIDENGAALKVPAEVLGEMESRMRDTAAR